MDRMFFLENTFVNFSQNYDFLKIMTIHNILN